MLLALATGLAFLLPAVTAEACETVEVRSTAMELERNALAFFEQQSLIYEGIILGGHSYKLGGRFLVLKVYKGPAKPFTILDLPTGSSCYNGVPSFSVGFWSNYSTVADSFDGLVSPDYVESWKKHGLVDGGVLSPSRPIGVFYLIIAIALMIVFALLVRKRRKNSG